MRALLCCTSQFAKTEGPFSCRRDPAYRRVDGVWGAHQTTSLSSRSLSNPTVSGSCPNSRSAADCECNEITCVAFVGVGMSDGRRPGCRPFFSAPTAMPPATSRRNAESLFVANLKPFSTASTHFRRGLRGLIALHHWQCTAYPARPAGLRTAQCCRKRRQLASFAVALPGSCT